MPQLITTDAGQVKVAGVILPGVFESLEISGAAQLDQVEIKGKKERVTQAVGYDPARVRLTLNLLPPEEGGDCAAQVTELQKMFRKTPEQQKPGVYQLVNKHTAARNISEVIFSGLQTWEDNKSDKMLVICEFMEHVPIKVPVASKRPAAPSPAAQPRPPAKPKPKSIADFRMMDNKPSKPTSIADFRMMDNKTSQTPAKDERKPGLGRRILSWLRGADNA